MNHELWVCLFKKRKARRLSAFANSCALGVAMPCGLGGLDDLLCPERLRNPVTVLVYEGEKDNRSGRPRRRLHLLKVHPSVGKSVLVEKILIPEHSEEELSALLHLDRGLVDWTGPERLSPTIGIDASYLFHADEHWFAHNEVLGPFVESHGLVTPHLAPPCILVYVKRTKRYFNNSI